MGLYFQMLEWLMILFSCITFLSVRLERYMKEY